MNEPPANDRRTLENYRPYLRILARLHLEPAVHDRLDPSDIVQQTLLEAHQSQASFRGKSEQQWLAWLRQILARNVADEVRKLRRHKRNIYLEQSLESAFQQSSLCLQRWMEHDDLGPEARLLHNEQLIELAAAIDALPSDQRQAVIWHHLQGLSAAEIFARMQRTEVSVAGLLRRGLRNLRQRLRRDDD